jgi:hypothetical protein
VPRGQSSSYGDLVADVDATDGRMTFADSGRVLSKRQDGFIRATPGSASPRIDGFFVGRGVDNLTGTYRRGDDGAVHYVMETAVLPPASAGSDIAWFARHPDSLYARVFVGRRVGTRITGEWADLPGLSQQDGLGSIDNFQVIDLFGGSRPETRAVALLRSEGASRQVLTRYESILMNVRFQSLKVSLAGDRAGRDEPFVWLAVFKFDGERFNLISDGSVASSSFVQVLSSGVGGHGNLGDVSVTTGTVLPIPERVGTFMGVRLRSVGGLNPTEALARQLPMLGLIAVGWEEESTTSDRAISVAHDAFLGALLTQLNTLIVSLISGVLTSGAIDTSALAAGIDRVSVNITRTIKDTLVEEGDDFPDIITAGIDPDRFVGFSSQQFSLATLASQAIISGVRYHPFSMELHSSGEQSVYTITGRIEITHSPRRLFERSGGYSVPQLEGYIFDPDGPAPPNTVPLRRWWSEERKDSFTTSNPAFANPVRDSFSPDYRLSSGVRGGLQGYVFDPRSISAPAGAVALRTWWSDERKDNWTAADLFSKAGATRVLSPDYQLIEHYPLDGYIFDPRLPRPPGTVPLVRWWSASNSDNLTSSERGWRIG